ncbi:ABC transporter ATP-binding protein [Brevibacillus sp. SYSU BS000544]|uniref:ABC transporter ATP-binding protein n=1 Tax=Brevibacillus sp. SYSU BS000544 TaxID=3416443 RepID=UPI003CE4ABA6
MISIRGLKKTYTVSNTETPVLDIAQLHVSKGEKVAIIGPSGCGKSTLLHIIGGVIEVNEGQILVNEIDISKLGERARDQFRARQIGYVFQDFHLIPSLTAEENVKLILPQMRKQEQEQLLADWFERVGLADRRDHRPGQLSRGQQQRVALIRAFINQPGIVLADEPTGSLDYETAGEMMELMLKLCSESGQTLLCVTHDLPLAERFPKVIQMQDYNQLLMERRRLA